MEIGTSLEQRAVDAGPLRLRRGRKRENNKPKKGKERITTIQNRPAVQKRTARLRRERNLHHRGQKTKLSKKQSQIYESF